MRVREKESGRGRESAGAKREMGMGCVCREVEKRGDGGTWRWWRSTRRVSSDDLEWESGIGEGVKKKSNPCPDTTTQTNRDTTKVTIFFPLREETNGLTLVYFSETTVSNCQ